MYLNIERLYMTKVKVKWLSHVRLFVTRPTLCDPVDCSLRDSPIHEIFQARELEWVAISTGNIIIMKS